MIFLNLLRNVSHHERDVQIIGLVHWLIPRSSRNQHLLQHKFTNAVILNSVSLCRFYATDKGVSSVATPEKVTTVTPPYVFPVYVWHERGTYHLIFLDVLTLPCCTETVTTTSDYHRERSLRDHGMV